MEKLATILHSFASNYLHVVGAATVFFVLGLITFYKRPLLGISLILAGFLVVAAAILT